MDTKTKAHWSFWLICIVMLIWNVMGCINFSIQLNPNVIHHYRTSEQLIIAHRPLWATIAFAVAVFGGALGSLLLIFRKSVAYKLFLISLLGVMITMIYSFSVGAHFEPAEIFGIILLPIVIAVFLVAYSKYAINKQWIG